MEPFEWSVRVVAREKEAATVFARRHSFLVGAPLQFDPEYPRITALEYVLGAIAADVSNGLLSLARKRRVEVDQVEALIQGRLDNPLTYLGVVGEDGHPGIERIRIQVYASSVEDEEKVRQVWDEALTRSPMVCTFGSAFDIELSLKVIV